MVIVICGVLISKRKTKAMSKLKDYNGEIEVLPDWLKLPKGEIDFLYDLLNR